MERETAFPELFGDIFAVRALTKVELATIPEPYHEAHKHSAHHRAEIMASKLCGCFYCGETFPPEDIEEWTDEDEFGVGQTALCPRCTIDSVLGDASGYELSEEFLMQMHSQWFGR